ncbi:MAG: SDR family NAD(P)-dependent oxidoreductase [Clostridiales bacterium]|jgi:NAD(P)-dependent dehydrogenase (short-subunit alcohol dehydrogenase family)|nr:SDR family NAD(P)-dependent oxidoreductase [Clostridiales bacterium]
MKRVAIVTGASSGIGRAAAILLAARGFAVYGAARRAGRLAKLERFGVKPLPLDVTDEAACHRAVNRVAAREGRVDVLVNCAGYGSFGAVEDVPPDEALRQFEVNVLGTARMSRLCLPRMRRSGGRIINISSVAATVCVPFAGLYFASKSAVEGLSGCLRQETAPFGVRVVTIRPGLIRTNFWKTASAKLENASARGAYGSPARTAAATWRKQAMSGRLMSRPRDIALAILYAAAVPKPPAIVTVGALVRLMPAMRAVLGDRAFDRMARFALTSGLLK